MTAAIDLLAELVGPERLWVVATAEVDHRVGRRVELPCDRGTLPSSLLGLIEVVVAAPGALTVIATPHAPASADDAPLLIGGAEALLRAFARTAPRLTRMFAYSALMKGPEREQFLLRAFVGLPIADLSPGFARSGRVRHQCHGEADCGARSRWNRAMAAPT